MKIDLREYKNAHKNLEKFIKQNPTVKKTEIIGRFGIMSSMPLEIGRASCRERV